ncbi:transposase [Escherichia coli]|nr:transposase [Escherichia coli]
MGDIVYLRIIGEKQGDISSGCGTYASVGNRWQVGHEDEIFAFALTNAITSTGKGKVEHPFRIIKRQFGFVKARYKGLLKNDNQLAMLFTLANLFRVDQMIRQWERSH